MNMRIVCRAAVLSVTLCAGLAMSAFSQTPPPLPPPEPKPVEKPAAPADKSGTIANLQKAFEMESTMKAVCEAYAKAADAEGYKGVGTLFRAMAESQAIRAGKRAAMIKKLGGELKPFKVVPPPEAKTTKENIETVIKASTDAKDTIYPAFATQAQTDAVDGAVISFKGASAVEAEAINLCQQALGNMEAWKSAVELYVCEVCSLVMKDKTLEKCPVCSAPRSKFDVIK